MMIIKEKIILLFNCLAIHAHLTIIFTINVVHSPYSTVTVFSSVSTSLLVPAGHLFILHMFVTTVDLTQSNDCGGVW